MRFPSHPPSCLSSPSRLSSRFPSRRASRHPMSVSHSHGARSRSESSPLSNYRADENGAYRGTPARNTNRPAPLPIPHPASQDGKAPLAPPACFVMPCGIQYHQKQLMMSSDVIIDTVPCLPSRPSSRIRPVLISYRIPDDIKTQSITCDI